MRKLSFVLTLWVMSTIQVFAPVSNFTAQVKQIEKDAKIFNLDAKMVTAIFLSEDLNLRNTTTRHKNIWYYGPGEICFETARDMGYAGTRTGLKDFKVNTYYAVKFLSVMFGFYDSDWQKTIQYYKTGNCKGRLYYDRVMEIYKRLVL